MLVVLLAYQSNLAFELPLHLLIHVIKVEVLVLFVEVVQDFSLRLDLLVNSQKGRDFRVLNVDEVFIRQIFKQDVSSISPVLSQAFQDAHLPLYGALANFAGVIGVLLLVIHHLVVNELVIPIILP